MNEKEILEGFLARDLYESIRHVREYASVETLAFALLGALEPEEIKEVIKILKTKV